MVYGLCYYNSGEGKNLEDRIGSDMDLLSEPDLDQSPGRPTV